MTDLEAAWDRVLLNTPPGWWVGRPTFKHHDNMWQVYAYDARETPNIGRR